MFGIFKKSDVDDKANNLYLKIVQQSRCETFYQQYGVVDTMEARLDMIMLHSFLVLHRFKSDFDKSEDMGQKLFDIIFKDMDRNLRELGIGDVGISIRIKKMVESFYGRISAYQEGLEQGDDVLIAALLRNLYHTATPTVDQSKGMAVYIRVQSEKLSLIAIENFLAGELQFITPPVLEA